MTGRFIKYILILLIISISNNLMGQIIGVYAKKNDTICFKNALFLEEDTDLANRFRNAKSQLESVIKMASITDNGLIGGMTFTEQELKALKCNFVRDNADEDIRYHESSGTDLPKDFYAIGTKVEGENWFMYDDKYLKYENWSTYYTVENAVVKMMKIMHQEIKHHMISDTNLGGDSADYILYDYENLNMLYGLLKSIKITYQPDEIAIIIAPF